MFDFTYIYILTAIAMFILLSIINRSNYIEKHKHKFYILAIISNILILLGYVGRDLSEQFEIIPLAYFSNTVIYMCAPLSMFMLILGSSKKYGKLIRTCFFLEAVSIIIALSSPLTGLFFTISEDAVYSRGPLYIYNEILGILFVIVWAICSYIEFSYVELINKIHFAELFLLQICAIILQGLNSTYKVIYVCGAFVVMLYYAFVIEITGKYDIMTKVRNRMYYDAAINRLNPSSRYSVIMYDANGLKGVNDTLGHEAGDLLICTVASAITRAVGKHGSVYRIGGDEFVAIISSDDEALISLIHSNTNKYLMELSEKSLFELSVSSGMAIHADGEEYSAVLKRADKKMYECKNEFYLTTGKNRRKY